MFTGGLAEVIQEMIGQELSIDEDTRDELQGWVDDPDTRDEDALIALIERIGKGRFAQALAPSATADTCPNYIRQALEHIRDAVA